MTDTYTIAPPPQPKSVFDTSTPVHIPVGKFTLADFNRWGPFLLPRLKELWPKAFSDLNYVSRLRQCMDTNGYLFVKTDNAIGLARIIKEEFDPQPIVESIFVFMNGDVTPQAMKIYREMMRWGKTIGASRLYIRGYSDMTPAEIRKYLKAESAPDLYAEID